MSWTVIRHDCLTPVLSYCALCTTLYSDPCTLPLCTVHNTVLWPLYSPTVHCAQHSTLTPVLSHCALCTTQYYDPCTLPLCTVHSTNSKLSGCVFLVAVRVLYLSLSKLVTNPQHGKLASLRKVEKTEFQWNLGWRFFWSLHLGGCQCSSLRDGDGQSFYKFTVLFNHPDLSFEH